jgi:hypothetical protein
VLVSVPRQVPALLLAAAAVGLTAAPAAAAEAGATPRSEPRNAAVRQVHLQCTGDTVSGSAVVRGGRKGRAVTVTLLTKQGSSPFAATGTPVTLRAVPGRSTVTWSFNVADQPSTVTKYRASVSVASDTVASNVLLATSCAPAQAVPEAPVAVLVPVTLAATAAGVLGLRRRGLVLAS